MQNFDENSGLCGGSALVIVFPDNLGVNERYLWPCKLRFELWHTW